MRRRLSIWAAPLLLSAVVSTPIQAQDEALKDQLDQGIAAYRQGDFGQAVAMFEGLFGQAPNDDAILELLERSYFRWIVRMASSDDPRIRGIGLRLMELQRSGIAKRTSDADRIRSQVDAYFEADLQEKLRLKIEISSQIGRNAVPFLIERLGVADSQVRATTQVLIASIGLDAVPVLMAASGHSNPRVRRSVATLLGTKNLRHAVVAATLGSLAETDEDGSVRSVAQRSLQALRARADARTLHYNNARHLYLYPYANPFLKRYYEPMVYHLVDDQVVGELVAEAQLSKRMAEKFLEQALKLDPSFVEARALLACNDALQLIEYDLARVIFAEKDSDLAAILESQTGVMQFVRTPRLLSTPADVFFAALDLALKDRSNMVATKLLEVIDRRGVRGAVPGALVRALSETPSRRVRVRAAVVLAKWNGESMPRRIGDLVVDVLSEAVVNSGIRTAHKVMGNPENVNRFDGLFRELNIDAYSNSTDVERGISRAVQLPPDLVVVDDEASSTTRSKDISPIQVLVREMRKSYRTEEVPVLVVAAPERFEIAKNLYENEESRVYVVPATVDSGTLRNDVIDPAFQGLDDAKTRALELASLAARTLEQITEGGTDLPVDRAVDSLTRVLLNRHDSVRVPCLGALGNLRGGSAGALGRIAQLFPAEENSIGVREAAMVAVAKILDADGGSAGESLLQIIVDGMSSSNLKLREASYMAFGASSAPAAQAMDLVFKATVPGAADAADAGEADAADDADAADADDADAADADDADAADPDDAGDDDLEDDL